jgi:hypothetical protein
VGREGVDRVSDYILLMHNDAPEAGGRPGGDWAAYFSKLRELGAFQGGSAIGGGLCVRRRGEVPGIHGDIAGYIRVRAADLEAARALVTGNPVYEAGGTVEIRELPRDE